AFPMPPQPINATAILSLAATRFAGLARAYGAARPAAEALKNWRRFIVESPLLGITGSAFHFFSSLFGNSAIRTFLKFKSVVGSFPWKLIGPLLILAPFRALSPIGAVSVKSDT